MIGVEPVSRLRAAYRSWGLLGVLLRLAELARTRVRATRLGARIGFKNLGRDCYVGTGVVVRGDTRLFVGDNVSIWNNVVFWGGGEIHLRDRTAIGDFVIFYARTRIVVGEGSMIAPFTYVIDSDHGMDAGLPMRDQSMESESVWIGKDVWIAAGCTITKGAYIEDGAVVGANSVVNRRVEGRSIVAGSPVRVIGMRS